MLQTQVEFWKLQEQKRHNLIDEELGRSNLEVNWSQAHSAEKSASANLQNAESNRQNALSNTRNAETNAFNAQVNSRNADTNAYNAQVNARNADTNERNARSNERNAATNERNAVINERNAATNEVNAVSSRIQAEASSSQAQSSAKQAAIAAQKADWEIVPIGETMDLPGYGTIQSTGHESGWNTILDSFGKLGVYEKNISEADLNKAKTKTEDTLRDYSVKESRAKSLYYGARGVQSAVQAANSGLNLGKDLYTLIGDSIYARNVPITP